MSNAQDDYSSKAADVPTLYSSNGSRAVFDKSITSQLATHFKTHSHEKESSPHYTLLKEIEAPVPDLRLKLITNPEEAVSQCRALLQKLAGLREEFYNLDEFQLHAAATQATSQSEFVRRYNALEMSLTGFLAEALYQSGDWNEAAAAYERCISVGERLQVPEFQAENLLKLGRAYRHAVKRNEAVQSFERVLIVAELHGLFTQEVQALYNLAILADLEGQPEQALDYYQRGLKLSEGQRLYEMSTRFLGQLGQLYQTKGESQAALESYVRCLQLLRETDNDPESETIILGQMSNIYAQIGDPKNGIPVALEGLEKSRANNLQSQEAAFLLDLVQLYIFKPDLEQAQHFSSQALNLAQARGDSKAIEMMQTLLTQTQLNLDSVAQAPEETVLMLATTTDVNIKVPEVHYQRGNYYYQEGALERAVSAYSRALNLDPHFINAYINRGSAYTSLNHLDRALADYNAALELETTDPVIFFNRANVYRKRREYQKALADYSQTIALAPNDPDAYFNRGEVYRRLKRNPEAVSDFKRVLELSQGRDEAGAAEALTMLRKLEPLE